jgi:hypothetical protein
MAEFDGSTDIPTFGGPKKYSTKPEQEAESLKLQQEAEGKEPEIEQQVEASIPTQTTTSSDDGIDAATLSQWEQYHAELDASKQQQIDAAKEWYLEHGLEATPTSVGSAPWTTGGGQTPYSQAGRALAYEQLKEQYDTQQEQFRTGEIYKTDIDVDVMRGDEDLAGEYGYSETIEAVFASAPDFRFKKSTSGNLQLTDIDIMAGDPNLIDEYGSPTGALERTYTGTSAGTRAGVYAPGYVEQQIFDDYASPESGVMSESWKAMRSEVYRPDVLSGVFEPGMQLEGYKWFQEQHADQKDLEEEYGGGWEALAVGPIRQTADYVGDFSFIEIDEYGNPQMELIKKEGPSMPPKVGTLQMDIQSADPMLKAE